MEVISLSCCAISISLIASKKTISSKNFVFKICILEDGDVNSGFFPKSIGSVIL